MKPFFITLIGLMLTGIGNTSAQNLLFPELRGVKGLSETPSASSEAQIQGTSAIPASATPRTPAEAALADSAGTHFNPRQSNKNSGKFRLLPDNLEIVTPPVRGFAYCFGDLTLENQTGVDLKQMKLKLKFGGVSIPVTFSGVPNKGSQTKSIGSAGNSCQSFSGVPSITVESCQAGSWGSGECQSKIQYIPIQ